MGRVTIAEAKSHLQRLIDRGRELQEEYDEHEFTKWLRSVKAAVANIFGDKSRHLDEVESVSFSPIMFFAGTPDSVFTEAKNSGISRMIATLESMVEEIEDYWFEESEEEAVGGDVQSADDGEGSEVFVVHGHDHGAKEAVARFLAKLGLKPIILHEQPNQGQTILEKFERHGRPARFAVVILSPDDVAAARKDPSRQEYRARQNVVFELGFFIAALGRGRVSALLVDDLEKPSDYDGVVYVPFSHEGNWRMILMRELKASGLDIDANRAF